VRATCNGSVELSTPSSFHSERIELHRPIFNAESANIDKNARLLLGAEAANHNALTCNGSVPILLNDRKVESQTHSREDIPKFVNDGEVNYYRPLLGKDVYHRSLHVFRNDEYGERNTIITPVKKIEKDYIPVHAIKRNSVRDYLLEKRGREHTTDAAVDRVIEDITKYKKDVVKFAKRHVHRMFLEALQEKNIFHVKTMEEIQAWWVNHASDANVQQAIGHMMYLYFDGNKRWEFVLEEIYMKENNMEYLPGNDDKGCIARIISNVKNEQIRRVRNLKDKSGVVLTIHKDAKDTDRKCKRRKKGEYFVKYEENSTITTQSPGKTEIRTNVVSPTGAYLENINECEKKSKDNIIDVFTKMLFEKKDILNSLNRFRRVELVSQLLHEAEEFFYASTGMLVYVVAAFIFT